MHLCSVQLRLRFFSFKNNECVFVFVKVKKKKKNRKKCAKNVLSISFPFIYVCFYKNNVKIAGIKYF